MKNLLVLSLLVNSLLITQCKANSESIDHPTDDDDFPDITDTRIPIKGKRVDDWHIGNGGDLFRKHIIDAKRLSAIIVRKIKPKSIEATNEKIGLVKDFILKRKTDIANDIINTNFRYFDKSKDKPGQKTCGYTYPEKSKDVVLMYDICKKDIRTAYDTSWLILHEIAHHFQLDEDVQPIVAQMPGDGAEKEENFADAVAEAILEAWKSGRTDWENISVKDAPIGRTNHSAVWTDESIEKDAPGSQFRNSMIIWGGKTFEKPNSSTIEVTNTGASYKVDTDKWTAISTTDAPEGRYNSVAEWTGDKLVVWGGQNVNHSSLYDGGIWDAKTDTWQKITYPYTVTDGKPGVVAQTMTFISTSEVLIWGGLASDDSGNSVAGAILNYQTGKEEERWTPIYDTNALVRTGGHSTTFVGKDMVLIWGGYDDKKKLSNEGATYNFKTKKWLPMSNLEAPTARYNHTAVYSSHGVIVFGTKQKASGRDFLHGSGGFYDVHSNKENKWTKISSQSATERSDHTAVWTGKEMMIFGGKAVVGSRGTLFNNVSLFNPNNSGWTSITPNNIGPELVYGHSAIWTGYSMIIWGGETKNKDKVSKLLQKGHIYYP